MQVLSCRCQARARISSCLRCRRWPGVHAVRDRVPVGRGCSRQNRLRCFEGGAVLIRQRPSRHCSWGPARRFARQRRAACGIEIGVGHDCRFSRQRLCRLAALFAGCSSPPHSVCAVCSSAASPAAEAAGSTFGGTPWKHSWRHFSMKRACVLLFFSWGARGVCVCPPSSPPQNQTWYKSIHFSLRGVKRCVGTATRLGTHSEK